MTTCQCTKYLSGTVLPRRMQLTIRNFCRCRHVFLDTKVATKFKRYFTSALLWIITMESAVVVSADEKMENVKPEKQATIRLQFVCYKGLLESCGILKEVTGGEEKSSLIDPSAAFIQCALPDCAFYELTIRPPYLHPQAGKKFLEDFEGQKRDYVIQLRDGAFEPRIVHARPRIDTVRIDLPTAVAASPPRLRVGLASLLDVPFPRSTAMWGASPWYKEVQFSHGDDDVPFPIVLRGPIPIRAWIIPRHFASISGPDGRVEIDHLPTGKTLTFQFFHPVLGFVSGDGFGVVIGKKQTNKDGKIELTLNEGVNDFGLIDLSEAIVNRFKSLYR